MKKLLCLLMAALMVLSMAACAKEGEKTDKPADDPAKTQGPASALDALKKTWELYAEDEKFSAMGGDFGAMVDGAPGAFDLTTQENKDLLASQLHIPADQMANIDEAATLSHMMNANGFSGGVVHVSNKVEDFAKATRDEIQGTQWMCGFPDKLLIADLGGGYVLVCFGWDSEDAKLISTMEAKMKQAVPGMTVLYNEAIG